MKVFAFTVLITLEGGPHLRDFDRSTQRGGARARLSRDVCSGSQHGLCDSGGLKPAIAKAVAVDPSRQALFGHSLGGLFVLHAQLGHPRVCSARRPFHARRLAHHLRTPAISILVVGNSDDAAPGLRVIRILHHRDVQILLARTKRNIGGPVSRVYVELPQQFSLRRYL